MSLKHQRKEAEVLPLHYGQSRFTLNRLVPKQPRFYIARPMDESQLAQIKRMAQVDHDILATASESFRRIYRGHCSPESSQDLTNLYRFISERIVRHFSYEDGYLFPVLMANHSTTTTVQIITELGQEHARLLKWMHQLGAQIGKSHPNTSPGQPWATPWAEMMDFLKDLEEHAVKEDQLLATLAM